MDLGHLSFAQHDVSFTVNNKGFIKKWLLAVIKSENKKCGSLTIVFCSDGYLLKINRKYLNTSNLTDTITFDYCQGSMISGDVFVSVDRVKENAKTYDVEFDQELYRVIVHGILHLIGYGDKNARDKKAMKQKEDYYLSLSPSKK
jgi:rRNA maturation RNase YbeY